METLSYVSDSNSNSINSELRTDATATQSLELEYRRLLRSCNHGQLHSSDYEAAPIFQTETLTPPFDVVVKMEPVDCNLQVTCSAIQTNAQGVDKTNVNISSLPQYPIDVSTALKVETSDMDNVRISSVQSDCPAPEAKQEISEDIDDLDHIVLEQRLRMLLARNLPGLSSPTVESDSGHLLENIAEHSVSKANEEAYSADEKIEVARDQRSDIPEGSKTSQSELPLEAAGLQVHDTFKTGGIIKQFDSREEKGFMLTKNDGPSSSICPISVKVKDEPLDNSDFHNVVKVKNEPLDNSEFHNFNEDVMDNITLELPDIKSEWQVQDDCPDDPVEHTSLFHRLNFLMSGEDSSLNISLGYSSLKLSSSFTSTSTVSESPDNLGIKRQRKRRKTATNSVETALEEDAPGLLQVLLNKGVLVDEMKLYGETENDEPLDESLCEDSFSELEAVISKVFSLRQSFIKFPIVRGSKASRANYCLACLISLVEQTRYLQFRKWPVEWGWCRDLQSFIFVFEKHNRIVLERPEYGYATYFFELVQSLPIEWQIKRLVIAMKLTSCSRISIIENKELLVGEDLSEGEAKVLMEYGWIPNSGLGTMLNFCDRVVHDRRNEKDTCDWRSKLGKLLADGYNGGTIVVPDIPTKVVEYMGAESPSVKLEEF